MTFHSTEILTISKMTFCDSFTLGISLIENKNILDTVAFDLICYFNLTLESMDYIYTKLGLYIIFFSIRQ